MNGTISRVEPLGKAPVTEGAPPITSNSEGAEYSSLDTPPLPSAEGITKDDNGAPGPREPGPDNAWPSKRVSESRLWWWNLVCAVFHLLQVRPSPYPMNSHMYVANRPSF